jgi:L-2-hydroxyglutarate oxidase LhgO
MSERYDVAVIGGGIVGLATAYRLLERRSALRLAVVEKEAEVARHQSGHNTGVIHAGIYYRPGSFKARLCREGKAALQEFAAEHAIPFEICGKIIVALEESELGRLADLKTRGDANGVQGLELVGPERIKEIEPHANGIRALWSPETGIIDFRRVALALADEVRTRGGTILTGRRVTSLGESDGLRVLGTSEGDVLARDVISCAGLHSDRLAILSGAPTNPRIVPFRGDYYTFKPEARRLVRALINPVPDPTFPFLGVHFSKRMNGDVLAGPNAVLAFAREGYSIGRVSLRDLGETLAWPGFRRLMLRYMRTGLREMWRDAIKPAFVGVLRRYIPELRGEDLVAGPSGVRAQALDRDGNLLDDFAFSEAPHVLHVRNAPSPAATASLAIGRHLAEKAEQSFGLR